MSSIFGAAVGVALFLLLRALVRRIRSPRVQPETEAPPKALAPIRPEAMSRPEIEARLEQELQQVTETINHPETYVASDVFQRAVSILRSEPFDPAELRRWVVDDRRLLHQAAIHALIAAEGAEAEESVLAGLGNGTPWTRYVALIALSGLHPPPTPWIHELLVQLDRTWLGDNELRVLREWVSRRRAAGEEPPPQEAWDAWYASLRPDQLQLLRELLWGMGGGAARPWLAALAQGERGGGSPADPGRPDAPPVSFDVSGGDPLQTCGRLWKPKDLDDLAEAVPFPAQRAVVDRILRLLREERPPAVVVAGPPRTGKTTLVRAVMRALLEDGWSVLEATPDHVNAGMSMVGQLEARLARLAGAIRPGREVLWFVPDVTGILTSGSVLGDVGRSIGRVLRQDLESRRVLLLGECTRSEWEQARLGNPWLDSACELVESPVPDEDQTLALVETWLARHRRDEEELLDSTRLRQAFDLTRQYLDENQRPGNLFDTVRSAIEDRDHDRPEEAGKPLTREDLLRSVSRRTGLPLELLDDRRPLDLETVERFFTERILGQQEAVRCLVDRLAIIKAGVSDPSRPLGVFLFAGPTGTGKTEMAKTLADWLFGSSSRLLRLDMSEFKDYGSLGKLLGEDRGGGEALVDRIRREPFSVVLLDEFEKSHPEVWDLFLQVFDDGRLSDRRGRVADFRHCVILLTTNAGSHVEAKTGVGFWPESTGFRASKTHEAIRATFRPEFLNRLDEVVVFRPLTRDVMRAVLHRQLAAAFRRRGLRERQWAVEWDESATEFLLDKGFSAELGARPLQRAIERHVLAPLAKTIAAQQAPEGDQFLFIRGADEELVIDFVDPDAPVDAGRATAAADTAATPGAIALDAHGSPGELAALHETLLKLEAVVEGESWQRARQAELDMTSLPGFWDSAERFDVLDAFQTRDRVQRALASARALHDRLARAGRDTVPVSPLQQLGLKLYMVNVAIEDLAAHRCQESVLVVDAGHDHRPSVMERVAFARRLVEMYRAWARRRGASVRELDVQNLGRTQAWAALVQSFGAYTLLQPEAGLHVLETPPVEGPRPQRHLVRVHVLPVPPHDPAHKLPQELARRALTEGEEAPERQVVRRYRERPSPLVRDGVRGWRTGRIDRVWSGDFDLLTDDGARLDSRMQQESP